MIDNEAGDAMRGRSAWYMPIDLVVLGHDVLGFDYPMQGDERP